MEDKIIEINKEDGASTFDSSSVNAALNRIKNTLNYSLKENYGIEDPEVTEKFLHMHGLDKSRFDFINNFETLIEKGIADESVDTNSNKSDVSITGFFAETAMPINKLVGYRYLYRKMKEMYGKKRAKYLSGLMYDMSLALADSTNILKPYSYYGETPIYVKINDGEYFITLKKLFERYEKYVKYDPEHNMEVLDLENFRSVIKVWDDEENGFVKITRAVKHRRDVPMVIYKTSSGDIAFVTSNHPVIMEDGSEKDASKLRVGDKIKDAKLNLPSEIKDADTIKFPEKFVYYLGYALGNGDVSDDTSEKFDFDKLPQNYLSMACPSNFGCVRESNSYSNHLPISFMKWNKDTMSVFIAGLIDAFGNIYDEGVCDIKTHSYSLMNELYEVLNYLELKPVKDVVFEEDGSEVPTFIVKFLPNEKFAEWCSAYHSRMIEINEDWKQPEGNEIVQIYTIGAGCEVCDPDKGYCTFDANKKPNPFFFDDQLEYVYDITTETGRFVANGMVQHNCFSINASKLVMEGRPFGSLPSAPPHRVMSYINALTETVHQLSNHLCGAIAIGSFFLDVCHLIVYREHKTLTDLQDPVYRKYIYNAMQGFVHSLNMLSRQSTESPFSNVSVFDKPKLVGLLDDDNMGWYFQEEDAVDGKPEEALKDCGDRNWKDYLIEMIMTIEDIFLEVMDNGDPLHDHRPIEFPVTTLNMSRATDENGNKYFEDPASVDWYCSHDVPRYNLYLSEGNKIASCCFSAGQRIFYYNESDELISETFDAFVSRYIDGLGQYTIPENERKYKVLDPSTNEKIYITGVLRRNNPWEELVQIELENGLIIKATPDQLFLDKNSGELVSAKDIWKDFNKLKLSIKISDNANITTVAAYKSTEPVYDIEVDSKEHTFYLDTESNVIAHNCRLINDNDLFALGGQVNSFGGTALSLGSHRVCTVNMRRIAINCPSYEEYKRRLGQKMEEAVEILHAHKELLRDLVKKGTQPFIENGWLDIDRMFSTIGILGYYEGIHDLMKQFGGEYTDYLKDILTFINVKATDLTRETDDIVANIEAIPAETMAVKLASTDAWIYGSDRVSEKIYANQFLPLWVDSTVDEKINIESYSRYLTGGGIAHISCGEKLTPKQSRHLIDMMMANSLEHVAINPNFAICENDHYTLGRHEICPKCNAKIIDNLTRTVGFFVKTSDMTKAKREEDFEHRHYKTNIGL